MTDWTALIGARPGGDSVQQLVAHYGNPLGPGAVMPRGSATFTPSPAWEAANLVTLQLSEFAGWPRYSNPAVHVARIRVHRLVVEPLRATWAELRRRGLTGRLRTFDGWYNPRRVGHDPDAQISTHALGIAVDFDAAWNGYGVPRARMQIDMDVVRCFQECGWEWGGLWSDPWEDGMHFQWTDGLRGVAQPAYRDAMARVQASPVIPPAPTPPGPKPVADAPVVLVPDGQGGWRDVAGQRVTLPGGTVVNATDPQRLWIAER